MRVVLFLLILTACAFAKAERLVFLPKVYVNEGKSIYLKHIIDARRSDIKNIKDFGDIRISSLPAEGKSIVLTARLVSEALRNHSQAKFQQIKIPSKITVYNKSAELTDNTVYDSLLWHWENICNSCRVEIKNMMLPKLPDNLSQAKWRLEPRDQMPKGSFSEKLIVHDENNREITYWVRGDLKVYQRVPVAVRTLMMNHSLQDKDIKWEWRDVTFANDSVPASESISQMMLRQGVGANQIIWSRALALEKAVKRGELVKVKTIGPQWAVSLQAVTEQSGYVGDIINVRNIKTKKIITAEVIAPGEVVAR